jgi:hypothetical protein
MRENKIEQNVEHTYQKSRGVRSALSWSPRREAGEAWDKLRRVNSLLNILNQLQRRKGYQYTLVWLFPYKQLMPL